MTKERDFYSVLQVNRAATPEAIEAAYRRLSRLYDPAASRKPKAAARMREIDEAYEVLGGKKKRGGYDPAMRRGKRGAREAASDAARGPVSRFLDRRFAWAGIGLAALVLVLVGFVLGATL